MVPRHASSKRGSKIVTPIPSGLGASKVMLSANQYSGALSDTAT